jgi:CobQ-like glutamine amidotransferase family enzyme
VKTIIIGHLYPREMNIYGDMGNIITLKQRLVWRGFNVEVRSVEIGKPFEWDDVDIIFGGGGQDSGQLVMGPDLINRGEPLRRLADQGVPMLVICGLYQLFGRGFTTMEGQLLPGIDIFKASTLGSRARMIGNIEIESEYGSLVGFENHSGQTILEPGQASLGKVKKGYGNNPKSRREGAVTNNVFGTYMHGPVLPKNPALADHLLLEALKRHGVHELEPLDDRVELAAAAVASSRPQ